MYQTGGIGAKTIAAYAGAVNFAYPVMAGALLNVEMNYASGDDNAADNTVKTFDQLYPTNHGKYGLADIVGFQNLLSYRAEVQLNVFEKSQLMLGVVLLNKAEANDFVYSSTGVKHAQDAGNTETAIGSEYFIHYQTQLEDNIGFNAGLSLFNPGKALNGTASQTWSYVQTSLKF
jgi:hypothetical protein